MNKYELLYWGPVPKDIDADVSRYWLRSGRVYVQCVDVEVSGPAIKLVLNKLRYDHSQIVAWACKVAICEIKLALQNGLIPCEHPDEPFLISLDGERVNEEINSRRFISIELIPGEFICDGVVANFYA